MAKSNAKIRLHKLLPYVYVEDRTTFSCLIQHQKKLSIKVSKIAILFIIIRFTLRKNNEFFDE